MKPSERIQEIREKILIKREEMENKYPGIQFDGEAQVCAIIDYLDEEYERNN